MQQAEPEWIVTFKDDKMARKLEHGQLYPNRERIESVVVFWDTNSYYVNVTGKFFIINGGRRVTSERLSRLENPMVLCVRRNQIQIPVNGSSAPKKFALYLVGIQGVIEGKETQLFAEISNGGKDWEWKEGR